mmetsp:Transcript_64103/g.107186  ORF Transcript_64103/g.107186 Transcript_64103/m.107186 type:complete len:122 (-) Transcript_64103:818-1183(-)
MRQGRGGTKRSPEELCCYLQETRASLRPKKQRHGHVQLRCGSYCSWDPVDWAPRTEQGKRQELKHRPATSLRGEQRRGPGPLLRWPQVVTALRLRGDEGGRASEDWGMPLCDAVHRGHWGH